MVLRMVEAESEFPERDLQSPTNCVVLLLSLRGHLQLMTDLTIILFFCSIYDSLNYSCGYWFMCLFSFTPLGRTLHRGHIILFGTLYLGSSLVPDTQ